MVKAMIPSREQWKRWSLPSKLTAIGAYVGILGLVLTVLFFFFSRPGEPPQETPSAVAMQRILEPEEGAEVGQYVEVRGLSPFLREHHYLIVTAQNPEQRYVVGGSFVPAPDGSWQATARLGSGLEGHSQRFRIQVVSTQTNLTEGAIPEIPPGSHVSAAVSVFRNR